MPRRPKKNDIPETSGLLGDTAFLNEKCTIIGKNIRIERAKRDFTIDDLAECIDLSAPYIGLLERGKRCPSLLSLLRIFEFFNVTPNEIMLDKDAVFSGSVSVSEAKRMTIKSSYDAVIALLHGMNESELDYIAEMLKGFRKLTRQNSEDGEEVEETSYTSTPKNKTSKK